MSLLRRALAPVERRGVIPGPWDGSALQIPAPGSNSQYATSGASVTDETSLGIVALFAGVRIIADAVATTPLRAVTMSADGTRKPVVPSPVQVTDPFMAFSLQEGISQIVTSLILRGNAYLLITSWDDDTLMPNQLRILHPDQVDVSWGPDKDRLYKVSNQVVPFGQMLHVTGFMLPNALTGASIIEYCRNALGIGMALEEVAGQFFQNGILTPGIISTDTPLTDDQARSVSDMFTSRHSGTARGWKPVVMGGGAKFQPITLTLEDAQFLQSRQWTESQMATLLGIPPHLLGIVDRTTSWGTGIEVQGRAFVDYALRSFFVRIQNLLTSTMLPGMFADFVTDAITRADTATRYANYALALGSNNGIGWMNRDEVRALEGLPPLPNGDGQTYYVAATSAAASAAPAGDPQAAIPATDPATGDSNGDPGN